MKKLSEMKKDEVGKIIYLPYYWGGDKIIKRFTYVHVVLNVLGCVIIKTKNGYKFIGNRMAEQITCE